MGRRIVLAGLAGLLAAPAFLIEPASAAIAFTCDSVSGSAVFSPGLVHDKRPQSLSGGPTAPAGPAEITLASTNDAGEIGGTSWSPSLSADGTRVAFQSESNLDVSDTDTLEDIYVKDLTSGDITLASTSDIGVKGTFPSGHPSLSADGTRVGFLTKSALDPADTDTIPDAYVKDLTTGDLMLASTSDSGIKGNANARFDGLSLSGDGTRVAFVAAATNLDPADTDGNDDIYVKNLNSGNIEVVSRSDTGVKGNSHSFHPSLSLDGRTVAFNSWATNLDPADTTGGFDDPDVYVKNRVTGDLTLASTSDTRVSGDGGGGGSLSADGTRVAFGSPLDPADIDTLVDVYVKNLVTGDLTLASTSDTGVKGNSVGFGQVAISADGSKVAFFTKSPNLDPGDTDYLSDIYVKNLTTGDITLASTSDSGVKGTGPSYGVSLSGDGTKVAFSSYATNLDPAANGYQQIYVKDLPSVPTSITISGCSNGNSGTASIVDIRSYGPRPLGCPTSLGGAAGNDYLDTTPVLVGAALSIEIDWASGPNSYGVAAAKAGPTGTQWRFRFAITASPGHDTPGTNQYLPAAGSGFTKTRLQGKFDWSALDSFNCTTGVDDPLSWLSLANNGTWVAKTS